MIDNTIKLYSHDRMISQLYSLAGPQENLPAILMNILGNDKTTINGKLSGNLKFTKNDLALIQERFHNAVLQLSLSA